MGYDVLFFDGSDDSHMVANALAEDRIMLTRDTVIMKRRIMISGRLKAVLIKSDAPEQQMQQMIDTLKLNLQFKPFALCIKCNQPLEEKDQEQVKDLVPPFVSQTQSQYMECPACRSIYWRGTH